MHFELLVEDQSGKKLLDTLVPEIVGEGHTFRIHAYKGIGRIPRDMRDTADAKNRILLENLPKLLKGYGKTFDGYGENYKAAVVLICDLDQKCLKEFRDELQAILNNCQPRPDTRFCIAIEEAEAWLLGDIPAVTTAYPSAKGKALESYSNDSICGTWQKLADAIYPGGATALSALGWQLIGAEKSKWAEHISPHMSVEGNLSPSFRYFRDKLRELAAQG